MKRRKIISFYIRIGRPFEVLSTKWLSYDDVIRLKGVEEMVEVYYNSGQFVNTLRLLEEEFTDTFCFV